MKSIKKILSNTWVAGILCSIIAAAIISIATSIHKKVNIFEAVLLVIRTLWNWILNVLTFKVPVFIILIIVIGLWVVKKTYNGFSSHGVDNSPQWLKYKKSNYKKWIFAWDYNLNSYSRQYEIIHLRPVCQCGCELSKNANGSTVHYSYGTLICPKCGKTYPEIYEEDILDFKKVLLYDINNDLYPKEDIK